MRATKMTIIVLLVLLLLMPIPSSSILAQSGGGYDLTWNVVAGGGTISTGGVYRLGGTAGQHEAGVLTGGAYTLVGGFWSGVTTRWKVYLPLIFIGK